MKKKAGVTMVTLIITISILAILAGISVYTVISENNKTIAKTKELKKEIDDKNIDEKINGIGVYILEKEDVLIPRFDKDISMEIENIASEFVTVIKQGKILKVKEDTELYRGRNRDVLEVEYSIRK